MIFYFQAGGYKGGEAIKTVQSEGDVMIMTQTQHLSEKHNVTAIILRQTDRQIMVLVLDLASHMGNIWKFLESFCKFSKCHCV